MDTTNRKNTSRRKIDTNSPTPLSHQLRSILLNEIQEGVYKPGQRIPSERILAERFRISRASVRETIAAMLSDGTLFRTVGRGTFVSSLESRPARTPRITGSLQIGFWISESIFNFVKPGYNQTLTGIAEVCRSSGHTLRFHSVGEQRESLDQLFPPDADDLDGNVVLGGVNRAVLERLQSLDCPLVLVDMLFSKEGTHVVRIDYGHGTELAMQHLIELGHKEIGFIGFAGSEKYEVFWRMLESGGLTYNPRYVQFLEAAELEPGILAGYENMQKLLRSPHLPTAVLITNDYVALGAIEALTIAGVSVPGQMSIVGFDDLAKGNFPLTTVKADLVELGRIAARTLLDRIEHPDGSEDTVVPIELVVRGSTAPPNQQGARRPDSLKVDRDDVRGLAVDREDHV
jgi:DNA-binding LacI/PurR family transcriptional regulator